MVLWPGDIATTSSPSGADEARITNTHTYILLYTYGAYTLYTYSAHTSNQNTRLNDLQNTSISIHTSTPVSPTQHPSPINQVYPCPAHCAGHSKNTHQKPPSRLSPFCTIVLALRTTTLTTVIVINRNQAEPQENVSRKPTPRLVNTQRTVHTIYTRKPVPFRSRCSGPFNPPPPPPPPPPSLGEIHCILAVVFPSRPFCC